MNLKGILCSGQMAKVSCETMSKRGGKTLATENAVFPHLKITSSSLSSKYKYNSINKALTPPTVSH